ncbi:MAG: glycoside hydrolase family 76 protein [Verrucomicrobiia bacterium]
MKTHALQIGFISRRDFLKASSGALAGCTLTAISQEPRRADFKTEFLQLCDTACQELDAETRTLAFYQDSYVVRALAAAYDMTGKQAYLDTCRRWSDRMIKYQNDMTPKGAYYMHYGRKPGQTKGEWYVGDSSSIALGVLATAVRSPDPKERQRYLDSVKSYASLVINNYVGPEGGITDGLWSKFNGQWWCSTGIFGSLAFLLHKETGDENYRKIAWGTVDWLNRLDFANIGGPISFEERSPTVVMYILETYSVALPQLEQDSQRRRGAMAMLNKCLQWMSENQQGRVPTLSWDYNSHKKGAKFGGLPFHMYANARHVPDPDKLRAAADQELRHIANVLWKDGPPRISQLAAFAMMSYAEKLIPGAVYRTCKP